MNRRGFTLIELIFGIVLLTIVIAAVVAMMFTQMRYVGQINGDTQALDQLRTAQGLLSSEISDLSRGSVTFASADSIAYRLPIRWGIICGPIDRNRTQAPPAKKTKTPAVVPPYSDTVALQLESVAETLGSPVPDGFALSGDGVTFTYYPLADWTTLGLASDTAASRACLNQVGEAAKAPKAPKGTKVDPPPAATQIGNTDDFYRSPTMKATVGGVQPNERTLMFAYLNVSYSLKSDSTGGKVLYRTAKGIAQKLAWPFAPGAAFHYRLADGSESAAVAGGSLPLIRAVRANLPAVRMERGQLKADTLNVQPWMPLYNAR